MTLLDWWGKRRRKPCSLHWISSIVRIPSAGWNYQTGGRIGDFVAIYNVLGLIKSVCCCIPMFPYKCGRPLKENHKSVVKRLLPMAGSVKKFGTSRNRARPATLWQQEPWAWSQGFGVQTLGLSLTGWVSSRQASCFHICEMGTIMVPLGLLGGLNEIPWFTYSVIIRWIPTGTMSGVGDTAVNKTDSASWNLYSRNIIHLMAFKKCFIQLVWGYLMNSHNGFLLYIAIGIYGTTIGNWGHNWVSCLNWECPIK